MDTDLKTIDELDRERNSQYLISTKDCIVLAAEASGQNALKMMFKLWKLNRKKKFSAQEFLDYGLYRQGLSKDDIDQFILGSRHSEIVSQCCDLSWLALTEDKWLMTRFLHDSGIPVAETLAMVDQSGRDYVDVLKVSNTEAFKQFCLAGNLPCFAKENRGAGNIRAFVIERADDANVYIKDLQPMVYQQCFEELITNRVYMLQPLLSNHDFFEPLTDHLATVRVYNFVMEDEIYQPFCILKIPNSSNLSGNFWSAGNVGCEIDIESGKICQTVLKTQDSVMICDESTEICQYFEGKTLPFWNDIIQLSQKVARIYQPVKFQSVEFAITHNGPVLLEVNSGGAFELPQVVTQRGFLTDKVKSFFKTYGVRVC